mgnify:CR=1 FL=1
MDYPTTLSKFLVNTELPSTKSGNNLTIAHTFLTSLLRERWIVILYTVIIAFNIKTQMYSGVIFPFPENYFACVFKSTEHVGETVVE